MQIAVKYGALSAAPLILESGELALNSGQASVAQRLLSMYEGSVLIGKERGHASGVDIVRLGDIDPDNTLVINLDVLDSVGVFQRLHRDGAEPKIMNFQWINPSTFHHRVNFAAMGLSYACFPTFCSGKRTAAEVREVLQRWAVPALHNNAQLAWADLGVLVDDIPARVATDVPVVLYPAISMSPRKQPAQFIQIVSSVQRKTPIKVIARLAQGSLVSSHALKLGKQSWAKVTPLRNEDDYWSDLARTTAFVATSSEEAYGLQYVEAMVAGVIGIFPNREWARNLVPEGYPFLYDGIAQAEQMLVRAVTRPTECRAQLDRLVNGSFPAWVRENHNSDSFEDAFRKQVVAWFGE